jgi:ABC-type nitrate/sulfonate/bicarbonate transport system substrate-binding protein
MKKPLLFILLFFALIGGSLFFVNWKIQSVSQPILPLEKIRIGNIGEYSIFNIIAEEKGYFKDNGLDAQVFEYESGPPAIAALLAGDVDVAVAADFVGVRNIFTNPQLKIITQASQHTVFYLLARKDKGIKGPSDMKGKTVGVTRKSAGEFYLGQFLIYNNLRLTDIKIIDLTPSQIINQLESGQLDAAVIFDPHAYNLAKKLGNQVSLWSAQGNQKIFALTYSTDEFTQKHPEIIVKYLRSLIQAEEYTTEYPLEAQKIIAKKLHYENAYVKHMWENFIFTHGLDQALLLTMEDEARWVINNGLIDQKTVPNYLNFIYFDGLETVKSEAITIIH